MQYWKELKTEKLQIMMKYMLKYGRQEYLTYFIDYATL